MDINCDIELAILNKTIKYFLQYSLKNLVINSNLTFIHNVFITSYTLKKKLNDGAHTFAAHNLIQIIK